MTVITPNEIDEILEFETKKLAETVQDENDRIIQSWHSPWRRESLEHYVGLGWSYLCRDPDRPSPQNNTGMLLGYFIAQPLLFLDGQTQSLWVEHLSFSNLRTRDELCSLAYRIAREKHLQKIYFQNASKLMAALKPLTPQIWTPNTIAISTTKV